MTDQSRTAPDATVRPLPVHGCGHTTHDHRHLAVTDAERTIANLAAAIERYADQLRNDAKAADDDGVAVGLLRAADGLGDLLAATTPLRLDPHRIVNADTAAALRDRDEARACLRDAMAELRDRTAELRDAERTIAALTAERDKARRERDSLARRLGVRFQELEQARADLARVRAEVEEGTIDIAIRDQIAADALRWAADRIDPGPRKSRPGSIDETHDLIMCADRGTATKLRFCSDQVLRGYIEPRPAGSTRPGSRPNRAQVCAGCGDDIWPNERTHPAGTGGVLCEVCNAKAARAQDRAERAED